MIFLGARRFCFFRLSVQLFALAFLCDGEIAFNSSKENFSLAITEKVLKQCYNLG
jgi:hypothetical protein